MKKTIAIVAGGDSSEHDVSLRSAAGINSWLDRDKFIVYIVEISSKAWLAHLEDGATTPVNRHDFSFDDNGKRIVPDFAYITIHGTPGEDGLLQGYFDLLHIPYSTSGVFIEAMTFNKFALNQYLKGFGVRVAEDILVRKGQQIADADIVQRVGLPCFIKPNAGGSSFGVTKCKTIDDLQPAIQKAREESDEVLIESLLSGTEISNGVYRTSAEGVHVLPITEVVPHDEFFDYDAKYNGHVDEITPARLPEDTTHRVKQLSAAIYDILGASGIIRIDYNISKKSEADGSETDVINLLEINTTPGMTATSFIPQQVEADGKNMTDVLSAIIEDKLAAGSPA
jgi:D-alanine-D-alanine ligase